MDGGSLLLGAARLLAQFALVVLIFVPLERLFAARTQKVFRRQFATDLGYYVIGSIVPKLLLVVPLSLAAWAAHHVLPSPYYAAVNAMPVAVRAVLALVVGEIGYYWAHRLAHEVPFLWRFHAIHHSAEDMDWLVNTRGHPIDVFWGRLWMFAPLYLLGLAQPMGNRADVVPLLVILIGSLWGFFIHANVRWRFGFLENVIATPGFHHWHHTNDAPALMDRNYSTMLPWVDRLFGTYHNPRDRLPGVYGISGTMPADLAGQLLYPFVHGDGNPAEEEDSSFSEEKEAKRLLLG
jgi:sterol desaturase/sphingolipid hydroxylase (fatty acid hydroxylase superfamily)